MAEHVRKAGGHDSYRLEQVFPRKIGFLSRRFVKFMIGDIVIREQTWKAAHLHGKTTGQPTWLYLFNFTSTFSPTPGQEQDIPFDFGNLLTFGLVSPEVQPGPDDKKMAEYMMAYFTNFAKTSNPKKPNNLDGSLPVWPAYKASRGHDAVAEETCGLKKKCISELASPPPTQKFNHRAF